MLHNFSGVQYSLDVNDYSTRPIRYLEIGAFYGANLLSVAETFCAHPDSRMWCIDPWEDYEDYPEYKNQPSAIRGIYGSFLENPEVNDKVTVKRGYSNIQLLSFEDGYFDIIYIDGNHEPEYVLEDAVLSFRKLKVGGVMIFGDYGWGGDDLAKSGIDGFLCGFHKKITILGMKESQVFVLKK
jgi:predicted O-methyltransferase YrrM